MLSYYHFEGQDPRLGDEAAKRLAEHMGKAIAAARSRSQMTQDQVAERLQVGKELISRVERGVLPASAKRLVEFARLFSCGAEEFLPPSEPERNQRAAPEVPVFKGLSPTDAEMMSKLYLRLLEAPQGK